MAVLFFGYCGLHCGNCPFLGGGEIRETANKLQRHLEGYEKYVKRMGEKYPALRGYKEFVDVLRWFASWDCPGCRGGGGIEMCQIRACCLEKGIELCSFCDEFPCERLHGRMITNSNRIRMIGVRAFVEEEEMNTGFE